MSTSVPTQSPSGAPTGAKPKRPILLPWIYRAFPAASAHVLAKQFLVPWTRLPGLDRDAPPLSVLVDGKPVAVRVCGAGPLVFLVHGWAGSGNQFRGLEQLLVEQGFRVATFDAPAHGASPGRSSNAGEFARVVNTLHGLLGRPLAVVGHSLGGLAAAMSASEVAPRGLVLLCPMPSFEFALEQYQLLRRFDDRVRERIAQRVERAARVSRAAGRLEPVLGGGAEVLLIHDATDRRIPVSISREIARSRPGVTYVETEGLGHTRLLADPGVQARIAAFITQLATEGAAKTAPSA